MRCKEFDDERGVRTKAVITLDNKAGKASVGAYYIQYWLYFLWLCQDHIEWFLSQGTHYLPVIIKMVSNINFNNSLHVVNTAEYIMWFSWLFTEYNVWKFLG